jgi:hypothetical protein
VPPFSSLQAADDVNDVKRCIAASAIALALLGCDPAAAPATPDPQHSTPPSSRDRTAMADIAGPTPVPADPRAWFHGTIGTPPLDFIAPLWPGYDSGGHGRVQLEDGQGGVIAVHAVTLGAPVDLDEAAEEWLRAAAESKSIVGPVRSAVVLPIGEAALFDYGFRAHDGTTLTGQTYLCVRGASLYELRFRWPSTFTPHYARLFAGILNSLRW